MTWHVADKYVVFELRSDNDSVHVIRRELEDANLTDPEILALWIDGPD